VLSEGTSSDTVLGAVDSGQEILKGPDYKLAFKYKVAAAIHEPYPQKTLNSSHIE
jgi:hypothetical protein